MIRKLCLIGMNFSAQMKKQNISAHAASIAFFFFLSIVPMLIMVMGLKTLLLAVWKPVFC